MPLYRHFASLALALCVLLAQGCASLPQNFTREDLVGLDAEDTTLAREFSRLAAAHPGQSGALPLGTGMEALAALVAAAQRGVNVRVVTNSLASTDVAAVHAGYKKSRRDLLQGGVELYEMKPALAGDQSKRLSFTGSSAASLHAKLFVLDGSQVFIGSMNLGPRSVQINTEIGLFPIDSQL